MMAGQFWWALALAMIPMMFTGYIYFQYHIYKGMHLSAKSKLAKLIESGEPDVAMFDYQLEDIALYKGLANRRHIGFLVCLTVTAFALALPFVWAMMLLVGVISPFHMVG